MAKPLTIFAKRFILYVWEGSEYASENYLLKSWSRKTKNPSELRKSRTFYLSHKISLDTESNARSSPPEVLLGKDVWEHPCRSGISKQLCWNRTSAWVFSSKLAVCFQNNFSEEHLWRATSETLIYINGYLSYYQHLLFSFHQTFSWGSLLIFFLLFSLYLCFSSCIVSSDFSKINAIPSTILSFLTFFSICWISLPVVRSNSSYMWSTSFSCCSTFLINTNN